MCHFQISGIIHTYTLEWLRGTPNVILSPTISSVKHVLIWRSLIHWRNIITVLYVKWFKIAALLLQSKVKREDTSVKYILCNFLIKY